MASEHSRAGCVVFFSVTARVGCASCACLVAYCSTCNVEVVPS